MEQSAKGSLGAEKAAANPMLMNMREKLRNRFAYLYKLSYIYASAVLAMGPRFRFAVLRERELRKVKRVQSEARSPECDTRVGEQLADPEP